jgi:hypothetical protein
MNAQKKHRTLPVCAECGREHATDSHPMCTGCRSEYVAAIHRRWDAESRLQPLADFWGS